MRGREGSRLTPDSASVTGGCGGWFWGCGVMGEDPTGGEDAEFRFRYAGCEVAKS